MAAVWRKTCGVIVLLARFGQVVAAVLACRVRRAATASRLIRVPVRLTKTCPWLDVGMGRSRRTATVCGTAEGLVDSKTA